MVYHFRLARALRIFSSLIVFRFACLVAFAGEPNEIERFSVDSGEAIYLPVQLLGGKHSFVLDTGSSLNVLDIQFADRLPPSRKSMKVGTPAGTASIPLYPAPEMKIGETNPRTLLWEKGRYVGINDFAELRDASESKCMGIIGMDFLKSQIIRLNLAENFAAFQTEPTTSPGYVEKIRFDAGKVPTVSLQISGSYLCSMTIDTGSHVGIRIDTKLYDRLLREKRILERGSQKFQLLDRSTTTRVGVLDRVSVGPYQVHNVSVTEGSVAALGVSFLRRFDVELDFPNCRASFRPSSQFDSPDRWDLSGFVVDVVKDQVIVHSTEADGIAEQNGMVKGDVILQINGMVASEMRLDEILHLKEEPDSKLQLLIQRDGRTRAVTLDLRALPDPIPTGTESPDFKRIPD